MRILNVALAAIVMIGLSGCATRSYVDESVAALQAQQGVRIDQLDQTSREALERAIAAGKLAEGKFVYSVALSDDAVKFPSGGSELSLEAQDRLAALTNQLKAENKNVYLEIQGHTDATGSASSNRELGLARAEAVRMLFHQQGVALNRMATISYGEDAPVASNSDAEGRAANRRVVVVVLN